MKKTKPPSRHEITERAFAIACDLFALAGMEINKGDGPATKQQFQRYLRGCARRELLAERRRDNGA